MIHRWARHMYACCNCKWVLSLLLPICLCQFNSQPPSHEHESIEESSSSPTLHSTLQGSVDSSLKRVGLELRLTSHSTGQSLWTKLRMKAETTHELGRIRFPGHRLRCGISVHSESHWAPLCTGEGHRQAELTEPPPRPGGHLNWVEIKLLANRTVGGLSICTQPRGLRVYRRVAHTAERWGVLARLRNITSLA